MQWQQANNPSESRTVEDLISQGEITENYARYVLSVGLRSMQDKFQIPSIESPLMEQLSCSAARLTEELTQLRSWTEKKELENGLTQLPMPKQHYDGWLKCLQVIEWSFVCAYLALAVESTYLETA